MPSYEEMVRKSYGEPPVCPESLAEIKELGWPEIGRDKWNRFQAHMVDMGMEWAPEGDPIGCAITVRLLRIEELTGVEDDILDMYEKYNILHAWELLCESYGYAMHTIGDEETQRKYLKEIRFMDEAISKLERG